MLRIVTLAENTSISSRFEQEFGLSLLIHGEEGIILMDMGSSALFARNAGRLGEDLESVDAAVLSHAHYDHGGGLATFFFKNDRAKLYLGGGAQGSYWKVNSCGCGDQGPFSKEKTDEYIGLDHTVLRRYQRRCVQVEGLLSIMPGVYILPDVIEKYERPPGNAQLCEEKEGKLRGDLFSHEMVLVIKGEEGLVVFTGCGHRGILNMVESAVIHFPHHPVKAVVGGFHLTQGRDDSNFQAEKSLANSICDTLLRLGVERVLTGHCTGEAGCEVFQKKMGSGFERLASGSCHIID